MRPPRKLSAIFEMPIVQLRHKPRGSGSSRVCRINPPAIGGSGHRRSHSWRTGGSSSKARPKPCGRTPTSRNSTSGSTKPAPESRTAISNTTGDASVGCRESAGTPLRPCPWMRARRQGGRCQTIPSAETVLPVSSCSSVCFSPLSWSRPHLSPWSDFRGPLLINLDQCERPGCETSIQKSLVARKATP